MAFCDDWKKNMAIKIKKQKNGNSIIDRVQEMSGVDLSLCFQCKKCTSGCPMSAHSKYPPAEITRRLQLGAGHEILDSDLIWMCASCETCSTRCPMGIDTASVMDALRVLAVANGSKAPEGNAPLFNKAFLKTVEMFGRTYELGMIAAYKIGTSTYMKDTDKFPAMLKKGKIALLPSWEADKKTVKRIFNNIRKKRQQNK
jgi:heterodisulfide reductase subunit C